MVSRNEISELAHDGVFLLRSPLLPFRAVSSWSEELEAVSAGASELAAAVERDRLRVREKIAALLERRVVREAILLASPSLDARIGAADAEPHVVRYLLRMAFRATPFGLFAGNSVARAGDATRVLLAPVDESRTSTRIKLDVLTEIARALAAAPHLRSRLRYERNSTAFVFGNRVRWIERLAEEEGGSFRASQAKRTRALDAVLDGAERSATYGELVAAVLAAEADVEHDEARSFVDLTIDEQVVVPLLAPLVAGRDPLEGITSALEAAGAKGELRVLAAVDAALVRLDATPFQGRGADAYLAAAKPLRELGGAGSDPLPFRVDLWKPAEAHIGPNVVEDVISGAALLGRIASRRSTHLDAFREAFQRRYEGREIPLCEIFDDEQGLALDLRGRHADDDSPLLEGLHLALRVRPARTVDAREVHLMKLAHEAARRGRTTFELGDDDLERLEDPEAPPMPDGFAAVASIFAPSREAIERGDYSLLVETTFGPTGYLMATRFCQSNDAFREVVEEGVRREEALAPNGSIVAEVVHLPEQAADVVARPALRGWEIPCLGRGSASRERTIALEDLVVSVRDSRICLRSRSLDREVLPRCTTAHNHRDSRLPIYRFLGLLAREEGAMIGFRWGEVAEQLPFLPRLTRGRVIIAPAQWRVDVRPLSSARAWSPTDRLRRVRELRAAHQLPRWVTFVAGDRTLPFDLECSLMVDAFVDAVRDRKDVVLTELLGTDDELWVSSPEGAFQHQLVVPLRRAVPAPRAPARSARRARPALSGGEWLYAKIYAGPATVDALLREEIGQLASELRREGIVDRWFFVRYSDPDWHLRLRLRGAKAPLFSSVLPRLYAELEPAVADGRVWRTVIDTYVREVERYGGPTGMDAAEAIFTADSEAILAALTQGIEPRWLLAVKSVHGMLEALGLDDERKLRVVTELADLLVEEQGGGALWDRLAASFRKRRSEVEAALEDDRMPGPLVDRSVAMREPIASLRAEADRGALDLVDVAGSLVHMATNRIFRAAPRAQEMVTSDCLRRAYRSRIARARQRSRT